MRSKIKLLMMVLLIFLINISIVKADEKNLVNIYLFYICKINQFLHTISQKFMPTERKLLKIRQNL